MPFWPLSSLAWLPAQRAVRRQPGNVARGRHGRLHHIDIAQCAFAPRRQKSLKGWHTREGGKLRSRTACPVADWGIAMSGLNAGSQCASVVVLLTLVSGCMQSRVEESRELHTKIQKDEAVVILAKPQIEGASAEDEFIDCVAGGLAGHG